MNILLIVITLLMVLASVSYSRVEIFNNYIMQQKEYTKYVNEEEKTWFNTEQLKLYVKESKDKKRKCDPKQLNLSALLRIGKKKNDDYPKLDKRKAQLAQLMQILYHQAPFYIELQEKRSEFTKELVDAIESGIRRLTEESVSAQSAVRSEDDLAKVVIQDPELQQTFYLMLKGTKRKRTKNYDQERNKITPLKEGEYYSLLEFVKYENEPFFVNSAPPESLELYFDKPVIEEILHARMSDLPLESFREKVKPDVDPTELGLTGGGKSSDNKQNSSDKSEDKKNETKNEEPNNKLDDVSKDNNASKNNNNKGTTAK